MKRVPSLRASLMPVLLAGLVCTQPAAAESDNDPFVHAIAAYEASHWQEAFAAFAELAGRGHAEAARIVTLMWRHGPALYRISFRVSEEQKNRWLDVAACGMTQADEHRCACLRSTAPSCRATTDN